MMKLAAEVVLVVVVFVVPLVVVGVVFVWGARVPRVCSPELNRDKRDPSSIRLELGTRQRALLRGK